MSVRIRNRDYVAVFTPAFRVMGQKRESPKQKGAAGLQPRLSHRARPMTDKPIQLLIKKGLITTEEGRLLNQP